MTVSMTGTARIERGLDVALSLVGLVASAPFVALAGLAMAVRDPGPVFFRDEREGRDGRSFHLLKLRTMVVGGDHLLDELPQLFNVFRGDMSLVGPRPLPKEILDTFDAEFVALRRTVKPGLTGLWQVEGRSDLDMTGLEELDRRYLAEPSLGKDLRILVRTPVAVLAGTGAY